MHRAKTIIGLLLIGIAGCTPQQATNKLSDTDPAAGIDAAKLAAARCAHCHDGSVPKAPHVIGFQLMGSDSIFDSMESGLMQANAQGLTRAEMRAIADHLGGESSVKVPVKMCVKGKPPTKLPASVIDPDDVPQGWGMTLANTRAISASAARLEAKAVPGLELKWAFAYSGATRARSQPVYYRGNLLIGSQSGVVYSLSLDTGCANWQFKADTEVRSAITIQPKSAGQPTQAFFGDIAGKVYSINPDSGLALWTQRITTHKDVTLTGSPRLYQNKLYVPLSSSEWASAADPSYACCTFRGGVVALDTATGEIQWTSFSIPEEPKPTGETNASGAPRYHPAGAPIWNSPTIDEKRQRLYVGTGEAYTSPAADTSDSVLAFDLASGELIWSFQATAGDAWNMACFIGGGTNCPAQNGPDMDIGAPPVLMTLPDGKDLLLAGQKSGVVWALDPDTGKLVWRNKIGRGGFAGGIHWGMAANATTLFAPNADTTFTGRFSGEPKPGLFALNPVDGSIRWFSKAPNVCAAKNEPACDPGLSAPPTVIPEVVFAGSFDGYLRAYATNSGKLLWQYNTNQSFDTVSGEVAHGGSIEADGPLIIDGHVLVNSGYLFGDRMGGNVLLAFSNRSYGDD